VAAGGGFLNVMSVFNLRDQLVGNHSSYTEGSRQLIAGI
jgi:hypothetical protein